MSDADEATEWLRGFVMETLAPARLDPLVGQVNEFIAAEVSAVSADRELRRDLDASTRDQARAFLAWLMGDSTKVDPPAAAHELARTIARRGLHLRVLMQIYRVGQKAIQKYVAETASEHIVDPTMEPKVLIRLWERASQWLNVSLEILTDTYTEERENGLRGAFARRAETVQAVLRGELSDAAVASHRLGHSVIRHNTALVLWTESDPSDEAADEIGTMDAVTRTLAATLDARQVLTVPSGSRGLWAWLSGDAQPDLTRLSADPRPDIPAWVHVAVGNAGQGVDGFRGSHREALAAQHISESRRENAQLIRYADVEIAHLLDGHPESARALVSRELSGLDGTDAASTQLRRTLRSYLAANRSPEVAARELGVHKNTVRYRVQRAEELLGRPVGTNRLKLELALAYVDTYGQAVLNP